jgi:hypothetical protein
MSVDGINVGGRSAIDKRVTSDAPVDSTPENPEWHATSGHFRCQSALWPSSHDPNAIAVDLPARSVISAFNVD